MTKRPEKITKKGCIEKSCKPGIHFIVITLLPLCLLLMAILFEYSGFDVWWVSHFYDYKAQLWPYRNHWLFDIVIHDWGRRIDMAAGVVWIIFFSMTCFQDSLKKFKKLMIYFLIASAAGPLIVGIGKHMTHIYTPWELKIFSGTMPYIRIFDHVPSGLPVGEAFPAGHASGGYAFFSLYFVLLQLESPRKYSGLLAGLILGLIFGIGQQIRGAHFPSHDLFTMVICWYSAFIFYFIFYPRECKRYCYDR